MTSELNVTPESAAKHDPEPPCECNVYAADGSGRVIAWRTYTCPFHKLGGWLDRHQARD